MVKMFTFIGLVFLGTTEVILTSDIDPDYVVRSLLVICQSAWEKWRPNFIDFSESTCDLSPANNPLNTLINFALDKPVVFGKNCDQFLFQQSAVYDNVEFERLLSEQRRILHQDRLIMQMGLDSAKDFVFVIKLVVANLNLIHAMPKNDNIVTDAINFITNRVQEHEKNIAHLCRNNLTKKQRSVPIETDAGWYFCLNSKNGFNEPEILCDSQEHFKTIENFLS